MPVAKPNKSCKLCNKPFYASLCNFDQRLYCSVRCRSNDPDRFWQLVDKRDGCWEWIGTKNESGYGIVSRQINGKTRQIRAHRLSWELVNGPIPNGLFACHHCDNPSCVRPDHLFLGTCADNVHDMIRKGRDASHTKPEGFLRGESHPAAKLTEEIVREIRQRYANELVSTARLAAEYGVAKGTMKNIIRGSIWRHVGVVAESRYTRSERHSHGLRHGKVYKKLSDDDVRAIRCRYSGGGLAECRALADEYGVKWRCIYRILRGEERANVT